MSPIRTENYTIVALPRKKPIPLQLTIFSETKSKKPNADDEKKQHFFLNSPKIIIFAL